MAQAQRKGDSTRQSLSKLPDLLKWSSLSPHPSAAETDNLRHADDAACSKGFPKGAGAAAPPRTEQTEVYVKTQITESVIKTVVRLLPARCIPTSLSLNTSWDLDHVVSISEMGKPRKPSGWRRPEPRAGLTQAVWTHTLGAAGLGEGMAGWVSGEDPLPGLQTTASHRVGSHVLEGLTPPALTRTPTLLD